MININRFENVSCNLCGSNNYKVIYAAQPEKEKDVELNKKFRASGDELLIDQLVQCKVCGLKYVNPRIKSELVIKGYSEGEDPLFVSQAEARERTFLKSISLIEKFSKKGKILDVGTAGGSFLAAAKKKGWNVHGCEPNKWLAEWGKEHYGINIKVGTVFDLKYPKNFFDVITLWDVIEHTPNPSNVLHVCNYLLKENGLLIVNYPDIGSAIAKIMGKKWLFLTSVHLYYFTPETMSKMLRNKGFKVFIIKPYLQTLELGYLAFRAGAYSRLISKICSSIIRFLSFENKQMPYWLGQTFIIARKIKELEK